MTNSRYKFSPSHSSRFQEKIVTFDSCIQALSQTNSRTRSSWLYTSSENDIEVGTAHRRISHLLSPSKNKNQRRTISSRYVRQIHRMYNSCNDVIFEEGGIEEGEYGSERAVRELSNIVNHNKHLIFKWENSPPVEPDSKSSIDQKVTSFASQMINFNSEQSSSCNNIVTNSTILSNEVSRTEKKNRYLSLQEVQKEGKIPENIDKTYVPRVQNVVFVHGDDDTSNLSWVSSPRNDNHAIGVAHRRIATRLSKNLRFR